MVEYYSAKYLAFFKLFGRSKYPEPAFGAALLTVLETNVSLITCLSKGDFGYFVFLYWYLICCCSC